MGMMIGDAARGLLFSCLTDRLLKAVDFLITRLEGLMVLSCRASYRSGYLFGILKLICYGRYVRALVRSGFRVSILSCLL